MHAAGKWADSTKFRQQWSLISASATTHFSVSTVVSFPCTISAAMKGTSAVACTEAQTPRVRYVTNSDNNDMLMTVEF
jgi:hypothetical protein